MSHDEVLSALVDEADAEITNNKGHVSLTHLRNWASEDEDTRAALAKLVHGRRSYTPSDKTMNEGIIRTLVGHGFKVYRFERSHIATRASVIPVVYLLGNNRVVRRET